MEHLHLEKLCMKALNMVIEVNEAENEEIFTDAVTGQRLRGDLVRAARREELAYFAAKNVWQKVSRTYAKEVSGRNPITVKWIDINKGDDANPVYRSRLVAREVRMPWEASIFAPTPPLESLRSVLSLAATDLPGRRAHVRDGRSPRRTQIFIIDIKRAYFNAIISGEHPTFVELPKEDADRARGFVAQLLVHMYGTRRAGEGWHNDYSGHLTDDMGFLKGAASSCVFRHPERDLVSSVYGDDFATTGSKEDLDWFLGCLQERYELTESARLGPGDEDDKEARILNRVVRWTSEGLEYEADPRQVEQLVQDLHLEGAKPLGTPGCKATAEQLVEDAPVLADQETPFRAVAARANYLAADRPECQFPAKEVCRWMSAPTAHSVASLKRLGRYLEGRRRLVVRYPWQSANRVDVYSDTDWAGCPRTRKSTSGGCLMVGAHLIKSWSSTQGQVALSSGEAEYYGVVKAVGTALGYQSLLADLGVALPLRAWTDSTATIGICSRSGLGKLRHIDTQCLWLQSKVRTGAVELRKVKGTENPADLFTKHLTNAQCVEALLGLFGCEYRGGRAAVAPSLRSGAGTQAGAQLHVADVAFEHGRRQDAAVEEMVTIDGVTFPAVTHDGDIVAEAWSYDQRALPHMQPREVFLFPKARACEEPGDVDPPARSLMGERWADAEDDERVGVHEFEVFVGSVATESASEELMPEAVKIMDPCALGERLEGAAAASAENMGMTGEYIQNMANTVHTEVTEHEGRMVYDDPVHDPHNLDSMHIYNDEYDVHISEINCVDYKADIELDIEELNLHGMTDKKIYGAEYRELLGTSILKTNDMGYMEMLGMHSMDPCCENEPRAPAQHEQAVGEPAVGARGAEYSARVASPSGACACENDMDRYGDSDTRTHTDRGPVAGEPAVGARGAEYSARVASPSGTGPCERSVANRTKCEYENVLLQQLCTMKVPHSHLHLCFNSVDPGSFVGRRLHDVLPLWRAQAKGESKDATYSCDGLTDETTDTQCMYRIYMSQYYALYIEGVTSERSWQLCLRNALSMGYV